MQWGQIEMAVTSIWPIKQNAAKLNTLKKVIDYARNPEKTVERDPEALAPLHVINGVMEYAADEMKTETRAYVSCFNCTSEETAAQEFMEVKKLWGKTDGRLCFHGYQSFRADEIDAETAHVIGEKLAERLWADRFQVVVATHCNTGHYHNHFVLNSVSFVDGYHFVNGKADYEAMRKISDELCREFGLSVIENPSGHGKNHGEIRAENEGRTSVRKSIRNDIDRAIEASLTIYEFYDHLESLGYEIKYYAQDGVTELRYPGLKPPGAKSFFRFHKLGVGYQLEDINKRILENRQRSLPFQEEEEDEVHKQRQSVPPPLYDRKKSRLFRLYLRYCYELHIIEAHPASVQRVSIFMREDIAKLDRLDAETRMLAKHSISSFEDLSAHRTEITAIISELEGRREELRNDVRRHLRSHAISSADAVKEQISNITTELRQLRKEVRLCDDISLRSARTKEELEWLLDQQENNERKEVNNDELFRRRGGTGREDESGRN